ncbi:MAG TPA: flagellar biosynthesis protein FlhB [Terriglobia bacterium]|nr:flagellar biosynthesis protein FlhB [Terriglobia bacterium]
MSAQERTEKPTSKRREKASNDGQFAYSPQLTSALTLAVCIPTVFYYLHSASGFRAFFASVLQDVTSSDNPELILVSIIRRTGVYFLMAAAPVFAAALLATIAGNALQGLPKFSAFKLKWDRLNPVQGLSRLKTKVSWIEWLKLLVMVAAVGGLMYSTFSTYWEQLVTLPAHSLESSNSIIRSMVLHILGYVVGVVGILAVADLFIQRWNFEKSIKQTKQEVKEDMKALEGNPQIKGKIRSIQREAARRRMMSRVKDADVIVTNPTHYAVALEYKPEKMAAPRVIAKGRDFIAQRIKELGREHDIPTVENKPLARALYRSVEVEQEIPMELYKAVAEVLAYVFKVRKRS